MADQTTQVQVNVELDYLGTLYKVGETPFLPSGTAQQRLVLERLLETKTVSPVKTHDKARPRKSTARSRKSRA